MSHELHCNLKIKQQRRAKTKHSSEKSMLKNCTGLTNLLETNDIAYTIKYQVKSKLSKKNK